MTFTSSPLPTTGSLTAVVSSFALSSGAAVQVATVRNPPTVSSSSASLSSAATTLVIAGTGFDTSSPSSTTVALDLGGSTVPNTVAVTSATSLTVTFTSSPLPTTGSLTAVVSSFGLSSGAAVQVATVFNTPTVTLTTTSQLVSFFFRSTCFFLRVESNKNRYSHQQQQKITFSKNNKKSRRSPATPCSSRGPISRLPTPRPTS